MNNSKASGTQWALPLQVDPLLGSSRSRCFVLGLVAVLVAACGNIITTEITGMTGVTVDGDRRPLLVGEVCDGAVVRVGVYGPNHGGARNEVRADLKSARPVRGSFVLDLSSPAAGWTGQPLRLPLAEDLHIAFAMASRDKDQQLAQVTFYASDLAELQAGTVQYGNRTSGQAPSRTRTPTSAA